jgi:tetraacyldisaccharide 4'-kinase
MRRPWLALLVPLYAAGAAWRDLRLKRGWEPVRRLKWPVISIGNLSTGGSGKTPLAIALAKLLTARGFAVDVLSRGYGRIGSEAERVDPGGSAEQFGDEPLLIAREADVPVYVARQRYDAGLLAEADAGKSISKQQDTAVWQSAHAHVLDDGFQHRQLARAVDILLLNRDDWQDTLLPAGNLREALGAALRTNVIAIPADDPALAGEIRSWGWQGPVWRLRRSMEVPVFAGPALAFCGIARPEQFFVGLEAAGARLAKRIVFSDHHYYTARDVKRLDREARSSDVLVMLTTEKDKMRLGALETWRPLLTAGLRTEIENEQAAMDWLIERLGTAQPSQRL